MSNPNKRTQFWLGNVVMAIAMVMLLFMGQIWELMGAAAMGLWIALVVGGLYLLMKDKGGPTDFPG